MLDAGKDIMTTEILVLKATEQDIPQIVELWNQLMDLHKELDPVFSRRIGGEEVFTEFVKGNIAGEDACVVVAHVGSEIVGYCQAKILKYPPVLETAQVVELHDCFVREDMRGRGIGCKLVDAIRDWCCNKGLSRVEVRHSTRNPGAGEFWIKMGFKPYLKTLFLEV